MHAAGPGKGPENGAKQPASKLAMMAKQTELRQAASLRHARHGRQALLYFEEHVLCVWCVAAGAAGGSQGQEQVAGRWGYGSGISGTDGHGGARRDAHTRTLYRGIFTTPGNIR